MQAILVFNAGSSSVKFGLYQTDCLDVVSEGNVEQIHTKPRLTTTLGEETAETPGYASALSLILGFITRHFPHVTLRAFGHRVVHGGERFTAPTLVTETVLETLTSLIPLAPLHEPHALEVIRSLIESHPFIPHIACFDTAFHVSNKEVATAFALPRELTKKGIRKYGFHGLSYSYIASTLPDYAGPLADARVIVAHLGNGASLCAMKERKSLATTMGFSALDGLMMGTRTGAIDPGVLLYLLEEKHYTLQELRDLLYTKSGLLGVSGISSDVRTLLESDSAEAKEALSLFSYTALRYMGGLIACLEGLDVLVFTGGIGEHASPIRTAICERLSWLGLMLDNEANQANAACISKAESTIKVYVIPTNEAVMIARSCNALLHA